MSSHFIHMNPKKTHDRYLTKTLDTNVTSEDKSKSKSSIIIINPKKHLTTISYTIKQIKYYSYNQLIKKYNTLPQKYNLIQLDKFIAGKYCRSLASFKEKLMFNYDEEFLKKYYKIKEIKKKIPLFYEFYKSYLQFFCSPVFSELNLNELIGKNIEKKAKVFYNENYNTESKKKGKTMNIVIFTSKIRRDLSRRTNLTNLSKTTIMPAGLTNKSSITSQNTIAKIFNEITSSQKENNNKNTSNSIKANKSFINKNGFINSIKKNKSNNKKKIEMNNIQIKNENLNKNYINKNINLKNKLNIKNIISNNIILNNNLTSTNFNNTDNNNNNVIYGEINTNTNTKYQKQLVKIKKPQVIKLKTDKNINNYTINISNSKISSNTTNKELKKHHANFNTIIGNRYDLSKINLYNRIANKTTSNTSKYNKNVIQKTNTRNYISDFPDNKNTFSNLNSKIMNQMCSLGNYSSNYYAQSLNTLNNKSIGRGKDKKILKIRKSEIYKIKSNNNSKNLSISNNKIKFINNGNNINDANIINNKNSKEKNSVGNNEISLNDAKNVNLLITRPYKKVSPYKNPDPLYETINVLKGINNNLDKKYKINNFNTIQTKSRVSNVKTTWNKKDKQIFHLKQKCNSQSNKENNKKNH